MDQVQTPGATGLAEGEEVDADAVAGLYDFLETTNLGDISQSIETQFKELNCSLEELLGFDKQDLVDFARDDLKLKSALKRNRFVNGILRLQRKNQENKNNNPIIVSEKENDILIDLENKLYVFMRVFVCTTGVSVFNVAKMQYNTTESNVKFECYHLKQKKKIFKKVNKNASKFLIYFATN